MTKKIKNAAADTTPATKQRDPRAKLKLALQHIMAFYYNPEHVRVWDKDKKRWTSDEINTLRYQQQETLYRIWVSQNYILNSNDKYVQGIQDRFTGNLRKNGAAEATVEIPAQELHKFRVRLENAKYQRSFIEAFVEVTAELFKEKFPEVPLEMPKPQAPRQAQPDTGDVNVDDELKALAAMGIDISAYAPVKTNDERNEAEGVTER